MLAFCATPALAQGSAPGMMNVKEIQIQHTRIGNNEAADICGIASSDMTLHVLKRLKEDQLPAFPILQAPTPSMDKARIDLQPEVVTLQRQGLECTSWVSLTAQSRGTVRIPPIEFPRYVTITYWRGGLMVGSTQTGHPRAVREAFIKLSGQFSRQFRTDQPPPMSELGE